MYILYVQLNQAISVYINNKNTYFLDDSFRFECSFCVFFFFEEKHEGKVGGEEEENNKTEGAFNHNYYILYGVYCTRFLFIYDASLSFFFFCLSSTTILYGIRMRQLYGGFFARTFLGCGVQRSRRLFPRAKVEKRLFCGLQRRGSVLRKYAFEAYKAITNGG